MIHIQIVNNIFHCIVKRRNKQKDTGLGPFWTMPVAPRQSFSVPGEVTDQDMLAPDCSPIHHRLLGRGRFKRCTYA